jgi:MOSC domain-containing protein YiiM
MTARLLSVQVGLPQTIERHDQHVETAIFKSPVAGRVRLRELNLDGDRQADLTVHGGPDKAVYVYPSEHYSYWASELPDADLPWGAFGENFTTEGLLESAVHVGDRFQIGSAEVMAVQPRLPCYKLALRFDRADMIKRFLKSHRLGFYLRVLKPGEVGAGDEFIPLHRDENLVTTLDIARLYLRETKDPDLLQRVLQLQALPDVWRRTFARPASRAQ